MPKQQASKTVETEKRDDKWNTSHEIDTKENSQQRKFSLIDRDEREIDYEAYEFCTLSCKL